MGNPLRQWVKISLLLIFMAAALVPIANGEQGLDDARKALNDGDFTKAEHLYNKIKYNQPLFPRKIEDLVKWRLRRGDGQEAWKLVIMAQRIAVNWPDMDYDKTLAALLSGICVLDLPVGNPGFKALLQAHVYRFGSRFSRSGELGNPYDFARLGQQVSYLSWDHLPYLRAIAGVAGYKSPLLISGRGCSSESDVLSDAQEAELEEMQALKTWWLTPQQQWPGTGDVQVRLLALALAPAANKPTDQQSEQKPQIRDPDLAEQLLKTFDFIKTEKSSSHMQEIERLSSTEQRFLWQTLIEAHKIPPPPYKPTTQVFHQVLALIAKSKEAEDALQWYALIDLPTISQGQQQKILDSILEKKSPNNNASNNESAGNLSPEFVEYPCLLLNRARLAYDQGQVTKSLTILRRLLVGGESTGDFEIEAKAEVLASEIITEYRFDPAVLGTIHALLPPSIWGRLFERLAIDHAVLGQPREFNNIISLAQSANGKSQMRLSQKSIQILKTMAERQGQKFVNLWANYSLNESQQAAGLAVKIGERSLGLSAVERATVAPFFAVMLADFEKALKSGRNQQKYREIISLLTPRTPSDRYRQGKDAALGGVVQAGVVNLKEKSTLNSCNVAWRPPKSLSLRPLLPMPTKVGTRSWEIK